MRLLALSVLSLACASALAAPVNQVSYGSLTGTQIVDFDDLAGGGAPGTNYDSVVVSHGVGLGERFAGQTLTFVGNNDKLTGAPTGPLTLVAGAPGQNLNVFFYNTSNVLTGLGALGFPNFDAIGEGAFALTFSSDQSQFGFQLVGGNGGNAFIDFFRADGSLIDSITVGGLADGFYGFSREGDVKDVRGISIWNDDFGGIGFDNLKHDVASVVGTVPEPETYGMLLAGLGLLGFVARRRKQKVA
jgi:hypothetical protein